MKKPCYFLLISLILLTACGEPVKSVLGDWLWVESTGGLLPPRTPENTGETGRLNLTENQWTYFENGQQTEQFQITIKRRSTGIIIDTDIPGGDKLIRFLNDDEITITYYGGPNTVCDDCAVSRFVRSSND